MSVNVDLLRQTLTHIETNPQSWDQTAWAIRRYRDGKACGTAYCFAGWAVQLAGHKIQFDDTFTPNCEGRDCDQLSFAMQGGTEQLEPIMHLAQHELGLDAEQARLLFATENSLADLRRLVDQFIAEAA